MSLSTFVALRIEVQVDTRFVGQSCLHLSGYLVSKQLRPAGFDGAQRLPNDIDGPDLWQGELPRHIGVDRPGVHAQDLRALLA